MAGGTAEIHQAAFREDEDVLAIHSVFVHLRLDLHLGAAVVFVHPSHIDLIVEVADVADDGLVLHRLEMLAADDVAVTGGGDDDVRTRCGVGHFLHFESVHGGLQCADGVDLGDDHARACSLQGSCGAFAHIAVTCDHGHFTGHHHVGCAADGVHCAFLAAVLVVELALGNAIVHVDRGHDQGAVLLALLQAVNTGGGLFAEALDVLGQLGELVEDHVGEVATVVEDHVQRLAALESEDGLLDAPVEVLFVETLPSEHRNARFSDGSGGVVLRAEDVAAAPAYLRAEVHEGLDQHGGLDGHVQAARNARALQRVLAFVLSAEGHQSGHLGLGQFDLLAPPFGERDVLHFVLELFLGLGHVPCFQKECKGN